jgi:hypothetical protein
MLHTAIIWHLKHHPLPVLMQNCDGHEFKEDNELDIIKTG